MGQRITRICNFAAESKMHVLLVGNKSSGKTTFLYGKKLKPGWDQQEFKSTLGYNYEEVPYEDIVMRVWDTPGEEFLFPLVRSLYTHLHILSNKPMDYFKAKRQIKFLINEPDLKDCLLAIVVNIAEEVESQFQQKEFLAEALGVAKLRGVAQDRRELFVINCKFQFMETERVWKWLADNFEEED